MFYVAISGLYAGATDFTLRLLEKQTDKDFRLVVIDHGIDPILCERLYRFQTETGILCIRLPYISPPGARTFDWGQWNSAFLLTDSDNDYLLRLQSWRVIPRNFIAWLRAAQPANVGMSRTVAYMTPAEVEAFALSEITPSEVHECRPLLGAYGDWFIRVGDFLECNGIDEPVTMLFHFEDMDCENRWRVITSRGRWQPGIMANGMMVYVSREARDAAGWGADVRFKVRPKAWPYPCQRCRLQWPELQEINDPAVPLARIPNNHGLMDLGIYYGKRWFYCALCDAPLVHTGSPHFTVNHQAEQHLATIGLGGRWGRNLIKFRAKTWMLPIGERVEAVRDSYWDPDIYQPS